MQRLPILRQSALEPEAEPFVVLTRRFRFDLVALAERGASSRDFDFARPSLADLLDERLQPGESLLHEFFRHLEIRDALMLQRCFISFARRFSSTVHFILP